MGVTEVARRTNLLPSDAHRILKSLASCGFIEQNPVTRTYRLGIGLMKLGLTAFQRNELRDAARMLLQRLSAETEATAHMAMFDAREPDIFLAEQVDANGEVPFKPRYGATASPHCTALGKVIAASLEPDVARALVRRTGLPRLTASTITRLGDLETEFIRTRNRGYGLDLEESAAGACCIGAPVRDWSGAVVAAVSVSMPAGRFYRFPEADLATRVIQIADELSLAAGHRGLVQHIA
jgi:DNA-binding IclR family transcriptional regulator